MQSIYELLGLTQPKRESQVRNDAYTLYRDFIHERDAKDVFFLHSMITEKYDWTATRVRRAVRRLVVSGVITLKQKQSRAGFTTSIYSTTYGCVLDPVVSVEEIPAHDELDSSNDLDDLELHDSTKVIDVKQPRQMEIANAIAEVLTAPMSMRAIARASGENKVGVDRVMKRLASEGCVTQNESGQWIKTADFIALNF